MPLYQYQCSEPECNHSLEALQRMMDGALTQYPVCKKETLIKVLNAPSFQLKGTGWYQTDFKDKQ